MLALQMFIIKRRIDNFDTENVDTVHSIFNIQFYPQLKVSIYRIKEIGISVFETVDLM